MATPSKQLGKAISHYCVLENLGGGGMGLGYERDKNYDSLRADPEYQTIMAGVRQRWQPYKNECDSGEASNLPL